MANAQTGGFHIVHICCVMNPIMKLESSKHEFLQQTMEAVSTTEYKNLKGNCELIPHNSDFLLVIAWYKLTILSFFLRIAWYKHVNAS